MTLTGGWLLYFNGIDSPEIRYFHRQIGLEASFATTRQNRKLQMPALMIENDIFRIFNIWILSLGG